MKIILDERTRKKLLEYCALVPLGNDVEALTLNVALPGSDVNYIQIPVDVEVSNTIDVQNSITTTNISSTELKNAYEKFKSTYPSSDRIFNFPKTKTLKKDPRKNCFTRFRDLVRVHKIDPDDIIKALEYEISWRKEATKKEGKNSFIYMPLMPTWLGDVENVKSQIKEMLQEPEIGRDNTKSLFQDV